MIKENKIFHDHAPNFSTFPLAEVDHTEKDSKVSIPSEDSVKEVKDWVDFKEM